MRYIIHEKRQHHVHVQSFNNTKCIYIITIIICVKYKKTLYIILLII